MRSAIGVIWFPCVTRCAAVYLEGIEAVAVPLRTFVPKPGRLADPRAFSRGQAIRAGLESAPGIRFIPKTMTVVVAINHSNVMA